MSASRKGSSPTRNQSCDLHRIAIWLQHRDICGREVILGIKEYAKSHDRWILHLLVEPPVAEHLAASKIDACITLGDRSLVAAFKTVGIPVVGVFDNHDSWPWPLITVDDQAVGAQAAAHILSLGLRRVAIASIRSSRWSVQRHQGFVAEMRRQAPEVQVQLIDLTQNVGDQLVAIATSPVAIFVVNDWFARELIDSCRMRGLRVPEDVAVMGVDDDDLICHISEPDLTSVKIPFKAVGYQAAAVLDALLRRDEPPMVLPITLIGVVVRRSTMIDSHPEPRIQSAMELIREHGCSGMGPHALAQRLGLPLRTLQHLFRIHTHATLTEVIRSERLRHGHSLLCQSALPIGEISIRCGFVSSAAFAAAFRKMFKRSPSTVRRD